MKYFSSCKLEASQLFFLKVSSPYQLLNGLSYINEIIETNQGESSKIYIYFKSYWDNRDDQERFNNIKNFEIVFLDEASYVDLYKKAIKGKSRVFSILVKGSFHKSFSNTSLVLIDDGLGSYRSNFLLHYQSYLNEKSLGLGGKKKVSFLRFLLRKIHLLLSYRILDPVYHCMFAGKGNNLQINTVFVDSFLRLISKLNSEKFVFKENNKVVVFLSQPYVRLNVFDEEEYRTFLLGLSTVVKKRGHKLYIKKHSGDNFIYEGFNVVSGCFIAEDFLYSAKEQISCVISFGSTALINSSILFGLNSYRIVKDSSIDDDAAVSALFLKYTIAVKYSDIMKGIDFLDDK